LEFRFRTTHPFGNYMQKGQATSDGGQIKVQGPRGIVQCLFKGAGGNQVGTGSKTRLDDGNWHTVKCVHTATQVREYVDGVKVAAHNGVTGKIDNAKPFVVGGKTKCDQVRSRATTSPGTSTSCASAKADRHVARSNRSTPVWTR
jgi:hypothetical protein